MISSYIHPSNPALETMLAGITADMVIMKNGAGQVYWPSLTINTIGSWNDVESYQVYMQSAATLTAAGSIVVPEATPIALLAGWNTPAYLRYSPMACDVALAGIVSQLVIAKNNAGQVYWPALGINTIGNMMPGDGYQMYMNQAMSLTYPANTGPVPKVSPIVSAPPATTHFVTSMERTGANAIVLVQSPVLSDGDEVGIMTASRVLVGSGTAEGGKVLVTVWGDNSITREIVDGAIEAEQLSILYWSSGDQAEKRLKITSLTDGLTGLQIRGSLIYKTDAVWVVDAIVAREIPTEFVLIQNYPNPFNPSTTIKYGLPKDGRVRLDIYNLIGQRVGTLIDGVEQEAGYHEIAFRNESLGSGVYFYRLEAGDFAAVKKMILMK
jgi:hypothetical protein